MRTAFSVAFHFYFFLTKPWLVGCFVEGFGWFVVFVGGGWVFLGFVFQKLVIEDQPGKKFMSSVYSVHLTHAFKVDKITGASV